MRSKLLWSGCYFWFTKTSLYTRFKEYLSYAKAKKHKRGHLLNIVFNLKICYCHELLFLPALHKQKYILTQMNEISTYAWGLLWTEKIVWIRERQVEIKSAREQAPSWVCQSLIDYIY